MTKPQLRAAVLALLLPAAASATTWTSPSTDLNETTAPTGNAGVSLSALARLRMAVTLCATSGNITGGSVRVWRRNSLATWARNADLELLIPAGWGEPCITWYDMDVGVFIGRAYFAKSSVTVSSGSTATLVVDYLHD